MCNRNCDVMFYNYGVLFLLRSFKFSGCIFILLFYHSQGVIDTAELQWLQQLRSRERMFATGLVRATEC